MLEVDTDIVAGEWDPATDWDAMATRAVAAALAGAGHAAALADAEGLVEVSVRLADDADVQRLNRDYRGKDRPTNILSFPMLAPEDIRLTGADTDLLLGDLVLAHETLVREAAEKGIGLDAHFAHLLVHGTLHLLGHDHGDDGRADAMEALETQILQGLGVADPYVAEAFAAGATSR